MDYKKLLEEMPKDISRRDMLKLSALVGGSALFNPLAASDESNETKHPKVQSTAHIVIVGGGDAGITIAARLRNLLPKAAITIVEPRKKHYYQPGQTLVASGVWELNEIEYATQDFIPKDVIWVEDTVKSFDPKNNMVMLSKDNTLAYDYLVVSTGLSLDYERIEGLKRSDLSSNGINSIYDPEAASKTFDSLKELAIMAKTKKVKALFTHPNTPIKCGGAPKKIMFLAENYLRHLGVRENVEMLFMTPGSKYFGIDPYEDAVKSQFKKRGLVAKFGHNLEKVDVLNKKATFEHNYEIQGTYDKDLEEYETIPKMEKVTMDFDFIHITPPMKAHDMIKASPLSWKKGSNGVHGLLEVDEKTLQHKRYANIFGAGDVIGTRYGKTGGSVRKQAPVVAENIVSLIQEKEFEATYDGYTVCPLITGYGTVMLAEFNYEGAAPSFPLDPKQERWIWWLLKVYALKPMYFNGMLKGRM